MNQRDTGAEANKDLLTISAQREAVRDAPCASGAAFRRSAATENSLRCQTAKQTAAAGVGEFEC